MISRQSLIDRAFLRARTLPLGRLDSLVSQAMVELARKVATDDNRADLLRKDFTLTVVSGEASLAAALTASEPMLLPFLPMATIISPDSTLPWQYVMDTAQLNLDRSALGMVYFTTSGSTLSVSGGLTTTYLDNDGERLREAMQRMVALEANHAMETDEYAEVLYETGRIEEAIVLMKDPIKKAHYQQRLDAILKDDGAWCNCDGEKQVIRRYPSMKHGKSIAVVKCTKCEFVNVSDQL